ncbi:predicted protein [Naegleria gruberi]|uniref:Predicted protein n=1 Tax=Naegleria gruberi TaxID=5762 RepID=D2V9W7_NAEGR|nr:uncharacterized protein NAEGRDRAFT_65654 [Naegleria gruberi]EFC46320.1 predicted protein [Naegleria gruberi]|eukprot:XP_002679064.1 predicted protein [Naegleria gruberi strain NEG-M]
MRKLISGLFVQTPQKFSLETLNKLCDVLEQNKVINELNSDVVIETLRSISELMVWGDKHNERFWDLFLERNVFHFFFNVLSQPNSPNHVKKQLIQSISIMIQNMNNKNSLYFLLSNNHINELINHPLDFADEELLAYYINFLKTISLKFDKSMIQFFFDSVNSRFPLYDQAIKFCNHTDSMIRIAVRTITLNTYSEGMDEKLTESIVDLTIKKVIRDSIISFSCSDEEHNHIDNKFGLLLETILYCISQVYSVFTNEELIERLTYLLFSKEIGCENSFIEMVFDQVQRRNDNESLLLSSLCFMYSMIVNESTPTGPLLTIGMAKVSEVNQSSFDQSDNCFFNTITYLMGHSAPTRINTYHMIYRILTALWSSLDETNSLYIENYLPTLKKQFSKCKEVMKKLFTELSVFDFLDELQVEFTQYQRLFSLRSDATVSDISTLMNYEENETSQSPFDQIPLQKSNKKIETNTRFEIHEFLLIYEFVCKSPILSKLILGREKLVSLSDIINPKPEYCPGEEAVMINRETIRCSITSPITFPQMVPSSPKKAPGGTPTRTNVNTPVGHVTPTKKDNREMRHIFFDANYLYIVTVDVNRIGFGIVEETVPLFTVDVCYLFIS